MSERLAKAIAACRGFALPFGVFWALLNAGMFAVVVSRKQAQLDNWIKMIAVAILGYVLILGVIFLNEFFSGKRK